MPILLPMNILCHPDSPSAGDFSGGSLSPQDALSLLHLSGHLGSLRQDPRQWRLELLAGITQILPAAAAAAFTLKDVTADAPPAVVSLFDAGFKTEAQRHAFLREFNTVPFADPLSRRVLHDFLTHHFDTLTCLRADLIPTAEWRADPHVLAHRRPTGMDDCILSLHRGADRTTAYALMAFRPAVSRPTEGAPDPGRDVLAAAAFTARQRLLLDTLHRGLDWLYRAEDSPRKLNRASSLRPRLRETLQYILAGDTERQAAEKMHLSVHTVHDYVKSLYIHFGVSSRTELLARWVQDGGQIPPRT